MRPFTRCRALGVLGFLLLTTALPAAAGPKILLIARDNEKHLLSGFIFAYQGVESTKTNRAGAAKLLLPPEHPPGRRIEIQLSVSPKKADEWILVNPQINIPDPAGSAEVVLIKKSTFRQIAAAARDNPKASRPGDLSPEERKQILGEEAARRGLNVDQLEAALRSFAETQDPKDKGISAYLKGQYADAEKLLNKAAEKNESDFVETLRYLGETQYEAGKYQAAAETLRKALSLQGDDVVLLTLLGNSFVELADWNEAEQMIRRSLDINEKRYGPEHPSVATDLNNLARLFFATDRLTNAELLMRRSLAIDENSFGAEDPTVAIDLNNLAILLWATDRPAKAEPLTRRALAIDEKCLGAEHPAVSRDLNTLGQLLQDTNQLAEAEPLMRRALAIDETSFGADHPTIAIRLNNLALLLEDMERFSEAEPLMRRALAIEEKSFGADHPKVATALNNMAVLLLRTKRATDAEPLIRRALEIDEKSLGADSPIVARDLNTLATLLHSTNRLAEADPLQRRSLVTFIEFSRRTGHQHPYLQSAFRNYIIRLKEVGKSGAEIEDNCQQLLKGLSESDAEIKAMLDSILP